MGKAVTQGSAITALQKTMKKACLATAGKKHHKGTTSVRDGRLDKRLPVARLLKNKAFFVMLLF